MCHFASMFLACLLLQMGQMFVSTELLNVTETDSQLAVVLGHEISHALLSHGVCATLSFVFAFHQL